MRIGDDGVVVRVPGGDDPAAEQVLQRPVPGRPVPPRRAAGRTRKGGDVISLLILRNLLKTFGGLVAMNSVTFSVDEASIVGLIGENGAGKSTLMNVLMGVYSPDSGEVILNGKKIENKSPYEALQRDIGMVPQELNLVPDISIAENIILGNHQKKSMNHDRFTHTKSSSLLCHNCD